LVVVFADGASETQYYNFTSYIISNIAKNRCICVFDDNYVANFVFDLGFSAGRINPFCNSVLEFGKNVGTGCIVDCISGYILVIAKSWIRAVLTVDCQHYQKGKKNLHGNIIDQRFDFFFKSKKGYPNLTESFLQKHPLN
jgi:hypothetical protein